jgi:hypothetical protein
LLFYVQNGLTYQAAVKKPKDENIKIYKLPDVFMDVELGPSLER